MGCYFVEMGIYSNLFEVMRRLFVEFTFYYNADGSTQILSVCRPVSLAWEVRKTSPGKLHLSSRDPCTPSPAEVHNLDELAKAKKSAEATNSWADMVKGEYTI